MKKLILILNVFITVIILSSCELDDNSSLHQQGTTTMLESSCIESGEATINSQETTNPDDYSLKIIYVQERVLEIIDDDYFQNGSLSDKVQLIEPTLNELIVQGYIIDYKIDLEQRMPYITLFYDDVKTSTIFLEELPDDKN